MSHNSYAHKSPWVFIIHRFNWIPDYYRTGPARRLLFSPRIFWLLNCVADGFTVCRTFHYYNRKNFYRLGLPIHSSNIFSKLNHVPTSFSIWIECFVKHKSQHDYLCGSLISVFEVVGFYGSPRSFRVVSWWNYFHHIRKGMSLILLIQLLLEALDQASLSLARTV